MASSSTTTTTSSLTENEQNAIVACEEKEEEDLGEIVIQVDRIKDVLACPVCFDQLDEHGIIFGCRHAVCDVCLDKMRNAEFMKCPLCRDPVIAMRRMPIFMNALMDTVFPHRAKREPINVYIDDEFGLHAVPLRREPNRDDIQRELIPRRSIQNLYGR